MCFTKEEVNYIKEVKSKWGRAVRESLMVGDSNRAEGEGIFRRVKIFMRKSVILKMSLSPNVIIISFPNCMSNPTGFHRAVIGSPVALILNIVNFLVRRKEHIAFKSSVTDKTEECGQDVEAEGFQSPTINMIQFMLMS